MIRTTLVGIGIALLVDGRRLRYGGDHRRCAKRVAATRSSSDDSSAFDLFNIVVMSYARAVYDQPTLISPNMGEL